MVLSNLWQSTSQQSRFPATVLLRISYIAWYTHALGVIMSTLPEDTTLLTDANVYATVKLLSNEKILLEQNHDGVVMSYRVRNTETVHFRKRSRRPIHYDGRHKFNIHTQQGENSSQAQMKAHLGLKSMILVDYIRLYIQPILWKPHDEEAKTRLCIFHIRLVTTDRPK